MHFGVYFAEGEVLKRCTVETGLFQKQIYAYEAWLGFRLEKYAYCRPWNLQNFDDFRRCRAIFKQHAAALVYENDAIPRTRI